MAKHTRELETRAVLCEVRAEEDERPGLITGRPIVLNNWTDLGWYDEMIASGALDRTDLTDVRFLVNHNTQMIPLARSRRNNGNSTMQLFVDAEGLLIKAWLDVDNNTDARNLYSAIERGDVSGMSFMFSVRGDEWDDLNAEHPRRIITDIESVVEVSAVTWPAYDSTTINARSKEALDSARAELERIREQSVSAPEGDETRDIELAKALFNFKKLYGGN